MEAARIPSKDRTLLDDFAMHAPEAPEWWIKLKVDTDNQKMRNDVSGRYQQRGQIHWLIEWRWHWARLMMERRAEEN